MVARFFRRLGFRYVFPISTLPVPYHPLILPAILAGLAVWAGFSFVPGEVSTDGLAPNWLYPAIIAVVLGLWLSIPVLSWFLLPFGGPWLQGVVIGVTMIVMVGDVSTGRTHPGFLVFPALFVGLFLYEFFGGPVRLKQLRKINAAFEPISVENLWFEAQDRSRDALTLLRDGTLARVASASSKGHYTLTYRLRPEQGQRLTNIAKGKIPKGWQLTDKETHWVLERKSEAPPRMVTVSHSKYKDPARLVGGKLQETRIVDGSGHVQRVFAGVPAMTRVPIFTAFAWTSIVENSTQKYFGFLPRARQQLWPGEKWRPAPLSDLIVEPSEPQFADEDMDELEAKFTDFAPDLRTQTQYFWKLMREGADYRDHREDYDFVCDNAKLLTLSDLDETLAWLKRSKDANDLLSVRAAAKLLDCFSKETLERGKDTVYAALNSRILAMAWPQGARFDSGKLIYPENAPVTNAFREQVGFGLLRDFPYLYGRLIHVSPRLRELVMVFVKEAQMIGTPLANVLKTNLGDDYPGD